MTNQMTTADVTTRFDQALTALGSALEGQLLISQDRCVDHLLDLFNSAPTDVVRRLVVDVMDSIRHLSAVRTDEIRAELDQLAAAAAVETAFFS